MGVKECSGGPCMVTGGRMRMCRHRLSWGWALLPQSCSKRTTAQQSHGSGPGRSWEFSYGSCGSLSLAKTHVSSRPLGGLWAESTGGNPEVGTGLWSLPGFWLCVEFVEKILPCHINAIGSIAVIPLAMGRAGVIRCGNYWSFVLHVCYSLFSYFSVFVSLDC